MITFFKKINRYLIYAILGVVATFAVLEDMLLMANTTAYSSGLSFTTLIPWIIVFSILVLGLLLKLAIYLSYRINNAFFSRKSGLLYPFPIPFSEYEATAGVFLLFGLLLCGLTHLPVLFLPSLASVLGAVRSLILWGTIVFIIAFFLKRYAHDYDKNSLAYSLTLLPLIFLSASFVLTLVEVIR